MSKLINRAGRHFLDFHRGALNIACHIAGLTGLFFSIYGTNWLLLTASVLILEAGHLYNHLAGIRKYDFRLRLAVWRMIEFLVLITFLYFISMVLR